MWGGAGAIARGTGTLRRFNTEDGAWWVANNQDITGTYYDDSIYCHRRYFHSNKTANALFVDGHVEPGKIGTTKQLPGVGVVPPDFKDTSVTGPMIFYKP